MQNDGKPCKKADTGQKRISWLRGRKGKFDRFSTHPEHICPHQLTNKPHPDISVNPPTLTATDDTTFTDRIQILGTSYHLFFPHILRVPDQDEIPEMANNWLSPVQNRVPRTPDSTQTTPEIGARRSLHTALIIHVHGCRPQLRSSSLHRSPAQPSRPFPRLTGPRDRISRGPAYVKAEGFSKAGQLQVLGQCAAPSPSADSFPGLAPVPRPV